MSDVSSSVLEKFLSKNKEHHFNSKKELPNYKISTGSKRLDTRMGGGFGPGIHRIGGASEGGKTSLCIDVVANAFETLPNCKCFYIKAEGRLSENIQSRRGLKFVTSASEWDNHTVFVYKSNVFFKCPLFFQKLHDKWLAVIKNKFIILLIRIIVVC